MKAKARANKYSDMPSIYPKVVVFDLDYTLWPCWCDTHISPPVKKVSNDTVVDSFGEELRFFPDVESIITELHEKGVIIVAASRTATPRIAQDILSFLHIGDKPALKYFDSLQWGQGSKTRHISRAAKELKLEDELKAGEFMLFDDEARNKDVIKINCHFAYISDMSRGLTRAIFERELAKWLKGRSK